MGPSWYWMPDVFERFFNCFGKKVSDYYQLTTLGSTYDTQLSVWQLPEEGNTSTNFIGCNDQSFDFFVDPYTNPNASMLNVPLTANS